MKCFPLCKCTMVFRPTHLLMGFQHLTIVNYTVMNIGVHRFFWIGVSGFLKYTPSSGIAGSKAVPFLVLWGNSILFSTAAAPVFIPTNTALGFPFLRSRKKEGAPTLHNSMDRTGEHYAEWNKPGGQRQILYDLTYKWNLINRTNKQAKHNQLFFFMSLVIFTGGYTFWTLLSWVLNVFKFCKYC